MTRLHPFALSAGVLCLVLGAAPAAPPGEQDAIRQVLLDQQAAWNRGDLKAFMNGYWHSPDLTFFAGGTEKRG